MMASLNSLTVGKLSSLDSFHSEGENILPGERSPAGEIRLDLKDTHVFGRNTDCPDGPLSPTPADASCHLGERNKLADSNDGEEETVTNLNKLKIRQNDDNNKQDCKITVCAAPVRSNLHLFKHLFNKNTPSNLHRQYGKALSKKAHLYGNASTIITKRNVERTNQTTDVQSVDSDKDQSLAELNKITSDGVDFTQGKDVLHNADSLMSTETAEQNQPDSLDRGDSIELEDGYFKKRTFTEKDATKNCKNTFGAENVQKLKMDKKSEKTRKIANCHGENNTMSSSEDYTKIRIKSVWCQSLVLESRKAGAGYIQGNLATVVVDDDDDDVIALRTEFAQLNKAYDVLYEEYRKLKPHYDSSDKSRKKVLSEINSKVVANFEQSRTGDNDRDFEAEFAEMNKAYDLLYEEYASKPSRNLPGEEDEKDLPGCGGNGKEVCSIGEGGKQQQQQQKFHGRIMKWEEFNDFLELEELCLKAEKADKLLKRLEKGSEDKIDADKLIVKAAARDVTGYAAESITKVAANLNMICAVYHDRDFEAEFAKMNNAYDILYKEYEKQKQQPNFSDEEHGKQIAATDFCDDAMAEPSSNMEGSDKVQHQSEDCCGIDNKVEQTFHGRIMQWEEFDDFLEMEEACLKQEAEENSTEFGKLENIPVECDKENPIENETGGVADCITVEVSNSGRRPADEEGTGKEIEVSRCEEEEEKSANVDSQENAVVEKDKEKADWNETVQTIVECVPVEDSNAGKCSPADESAKKLELYNESDEREVNNIEEDVDDITTTEEEAAKLGDEYIRLHDRYIKIKQWHNFYDEGYQKDRSVKALKRCWWENNFITSEISREPPTDASVQDFQSILKRPKSRHRNNAPVKTVHFPSFLRRYKLIPEREAAAEQNESFLKPKAATRKQCKLVTVTHDYNPLMPYGVPLVVLEAPEPDFDDDEVDELRKEMFSRNNIAWLSANDNWPADTWKYRLKKRISKLYKKAMKKLFNYTVRSKWIEMNLLKFTEIFHEGDSILSFSI